MSLEEFTPCLVRRRSSATGTVTDKLMDGFSSQLCILRTLLHLAAWQPRGRGKGERKIEQKKKKKKQHTHRKETEASEEEGGQSPAGDHPIAHIFPALDIQSASSERLYTVAHSDLSLEDHTERIMQAMQAMQSHHRVMHDLLYMGIIQKPEARSREFSRWGRETWTGARDWPSWGLPCLPPCDGRDHGGHWEDRTLGRRGSVEVGDSESGNYLYCLPIMAPPQSYSGVHYVQITTDSNKNGCVLVRVGL